MDDPQLRPLLPRRLRPRELAALDVTAAAGYALVLLIGAPVTHRPILTTVTVAAITAPMAARRRWPWPAFTVAFAATSAGLALDTVREPFLAAAYVLYLAALRTTRHRREPTIVIAVLSAAALLTVVIAGPPPDPTTAGAPMLVGAALLGAAWTTGRAVRERRAYAASHAAALADRAATEERLRIARELHDVVSHTLSMIGVKAGIARHVADTRPQEIPEALEVIETASRDALADMRRMLRPLRDQPPPTAEPEALAELAHRAHQAGVPATLTVTGAHQPPDDVATSAYRIAQEAVTNVIRHARHATHCEIHLHTGAEETTVTVTDNGHRTNPPHPGYGLIGMRERAARHGGTFTAGPHPGGGFTVTAQLPHQPTRKLA